MKSNFLNSSLSNINSKPYSSSEVLSQILYGEKFKILNKKKIGSKLKHITIIILVILKKINFTKTLNQNVKFLRLKSRIFKKKMKNFFL